MPLGRQSASFYSRINDKRWLHHHWIFALCPRLVIGFAREFGRFTDCLPLRLAARKIAEDKIRRCLQPSLTSSTELPGRKTAPLLSLSWRSRAASAALIQQTSAGTILKPGLAKL